MYSQFMMHGQKNIKKILSFIYPIYNHNWRNISALYKYRVRQKGLPDFVGSYVGAGGGARTVVGSASSNNGVRAAFSVHHGVIGRTSSLCC